MRKGSKYPGYLKAITPLFVEYLRYIRTHKIVLRVLRLNEEGEEELSVLYLDYKTRFDDTYKWKVREKLSGIEFKRCSHVVLTTDMNVYREIRSATRGLKRRWDTLLKRLRRELERFWSMYDGFREDFGGSFQDV